MITQMGLPLNEQEISKTVRDTIYSAKFPDQHGHLPPLSLGHTGPLHSVPDKDLGAEHSADIIRFGIDELLRYHYNRQGFLGMCRDVSQADLDRMPLSEQGDLIWKRMFVESDSAPIDVARMMIVNILKRQGLDPYTTSLKDAREFYYEKGKDIISYHEEVFQLAGVSGFVGTQDPFNPREYEFYQKGKEWHPLFAAALRLDALVLKWGQNQQWLSEKLGYTCTPNLESPETISAIQKFMRDWIMEKLSRVQYVGLSIPPTYTYTDYKAGNPKDDFSRTVNTILTKAVFPILAETGRKLFLMPEVIRGMNPAWREAGDYFGKGDMVEIAHLAADHPNVDFWLTPLNENSIQECLAMSRVLPNVGTWGVWWYNLQSPIVERTTNIAMDIVPSSKRLPFNSDARVLEHLIGKWDDWRGVYEKALGNHFIELHRRGWPVKQEEIAKHIEADFDTRKIFASSDFCLPSSKNLQDTPIKLGTSVAINRVQAVSQEGLIHSTIVDKLPVYVYRNRAALGKAAGEYDAQILRNTIAKKGHANLMVACAPSQNERLATLVNAPNIDWSKVNVFHMDEEVGMYADDQRSFRYYLKQHLLNKVSAHNAFLIDSENSNPVLAIRAYSQLLNEYPTDLVLLGIGENGHLAYNDPPADMDATQNVKLVHLDEACRQQQVNDGRFSTLEHASTHAITVTVPRLLASKAASCVVPGSLKAQAIFRTLDSIIEPHCPATFLREHENAALFLDEESAKLWLKANTWAK
jgi:glucosamine-6-phosphate deaminase